MRTKSAKMGIAAGVGVIVLLVVWWRVLPFPLFDVEYSTVVTDRKGEILGMTVAEDGQYRVKGRNRLSAKYVAAVLCFEDKRFLAHHGVDWVAMARAMWQNVSRGEVVSGGSTLSMQVIRLARGNPPRTVGEKMREMVSAMRLELRCSKWEILNLYATHAPFGGNIVGIEAASLKYFGRGPTSLSWAEAALLAVLPNAPALMYPGRNNDNLKTKRDCLLRDLAASGYLDSEDLQLALAEPLPERMWRTDCVAPHLLARAFLERRGEVSQSFVDVRLQANVNAIVRRHVEILRHNHIYNAAVLVAHVPSGEVRAYVGNAPAVPGGDGEHVDVITAPRSSGSILKPALYALMQQEGYILPESIVSDIPSRFGEYAPLNFSKDFQGVVPADRALAQSLNVPFVRMLRDYGVEHFYDGLKRMGVSTLQYPAGHYGLSLILGGAECTLWDLCNLYGGMVSTLRHYNMSDGLYFNHEYGRLRLWEGERKDSVVVGRGIVGAGAVWLTLDALRDVERPSLESGWKNFVSSIDLSWKTGTSFGYRDAWAVGVNAEYVIGVWVGNADGEGRPGLVGVRAAAPILFEVASLLRTDEQFECPQEDLADVVVCRKSGYRASKICPETDTIKTAIAGQRTPLCPYHRLVNLDSTGRWQVDSEHESVHSMRIVPWFVLSPVQEWYYARSHADYRKLPPFRPDCRIVRTDVMEMIYPQRNTRVFIPRDFNGVVKGVLFEMAHREPECAVYWYVDERFVGTTRYQHQMEINVEPGNHWLYLVDEEGNSLRQRFVVVDGKKEEGEAR